MMELGANFFLVVVAASGRSWNFTASNRFNHHFAGRDQPHVVREIPFELTKQNGRVCMIPGTSADRMRMANVNFKNSHPAGPIAGNQGRGPGFRNVDLGVRKNISLREDWRLSFRCQAFNVFNHPNFGIPTTDGGYYSIDLQFSFRFEF